MAAKTNVKGNGNTKGIKVATWARDDREVTNIVRDWSDLVFSPDWISEAIDICKYYGFERRIGIIIDENYAYNTYKALIDGASEINLNLDRHLQKFFCMSLLKCCCTRIGGKQVYRPNPTTCKVEMMFTSIKDYVAAGNAKLNFILDAGDISEYKDEIELCVRNAAHFNAGIILNVGEWPENVRAQKELIATIKKFSETSSSLTKYKLGKGTRPVISLMGENIPSDICKGYNVYST